MNEILVLVNGLILIFGTATGYLLKHALDVKREREKIEFQRKEERYKNLVSLSVCFYEGENTSLRSKFLDEMRFAWLYASDDVIRSMNKFLEYLAPDLRGRKGLDQTEAKKLLGELILNMRKDLGYKTTELTKNDFKTLKVN